MHAQSITQLRRRDIAYPTLLGLVITGSMNVAAAGFVETYWPGTLSGNGQILHTGFTIASLYLISFLNIRWRVIRRQRISWASVGFRAAPDRWYLIISALLCIGWAVSYASYRAIGVWDGTMAFKRNALMSVTPEFWTVLVLMISVASTAGFIEETLFRGLIHQ